MHWMHRRRINTCADFDFGASTSWQSAISKPQHLSTASRLSLLLAEAIACATMPLPALWWTISLCACIWAAAKVAFVAALGGRMYNLDNRIATRRASASNVKDQLAYGPTLGYRVCPYVPSAVAAIDKGPWIKAARGFPVDVNTQHRCRTWSAVTALSLHILVHLTPTMSDFNVCGRKKSQFSLTTHEERGQCWFSRQTRARPLAVGRGKKQKSKKQTSEPEYPCMYHKTVIAAWPPQV